MHRSGAPKRPHCLPDRPAQSVRFARSAGPHRRPFRVRGTAGDEALHSVQIELIVLGDPADSVAFLGRRNGASKSPFTAAVIFFPEEFFPAWLGYSSSKM